MKNIPQNFDITVYLRYSPILRFARGINAGLICEVGSGDFGIGPYLKKRFYGVDINFGKERSEYLIPKRHSAVSMPESWRDKFDMCLSVDMLEHLSPKERSKAISECLRVSKRYLCLAFPSGWLARKSDLILDKYYLLTHQRRLDFLVEHNKYPLPIVKDVVADVQRAARKYHKQIGKISIFNNTSVLLYLPLLFLGFSENKYLTRVFRFVYYFRSILSRINFLPYRKVVIVRFKNGKE
jgi:hypothetical protein